MDTIADHVRYIVDVHPLHGILVNDDNLVDKEFTQTDVLQGKLVYRHQVPPELLFAEKNTHTQKKKHKQKQKKTYSCRTI